MKDLHIKRGKALGLDYLSVKRELAIELPLSGPKNVKTPTTHGVSVEVGGGTSASTQQTKKVK